MKNKYDYYYTLILSRTKRLFVILNEAKRSEESPVEDN